MANSANVFTFLFSGAELKKVFPQSDFSHALVKVDLEAKEIGGKKHPTITVSLEAHGKSSGKESAIAPPMIMIEGCPIPPCTPPPIGGK